MTNDSKLSRISDSASGGKGESMASEIRSTKWTASEPLEYNAHHVTGFIEVSDPNDACFTALFPLRKDAEDYIAWKNSEKGLASRVEELEKGLWVISKTSHHLLNGQVCWAGCPKCTAEKLLAGAHAEEKE